MPARVVLVHDDPAFLQQVADALRATGHSVAAFTDTFAALNALDVAQSVDLLITRVLFPAGQPNGIALAWMAKHRRPGVKALFVASPELRDHIDGEGEFLPISAPVADVVAAAERMLSVLS